MAKPTILKERGTREELYPQTLAKFVQTEGGDNVDEAIDKAKFALFVDMWNNIMRLPNGPTSQMLSIGTYDDEKKEFICGDVRISYQSAISTLVVYSLIQSATVVRMFSACWWIEITPPLITHTNERLPFDGCFAGCRMLKIAPIGGYYGMLQVDSMSNMFLGCTNLAEILGIMDCSYVNGDVETKDAFTNCNKLQKVKIYHLSTNISFKDSPLFSLSSLQYLVTNAANTSSITVTVHPDVYAKLTDESNVEWNQVLVDAAAKNINFATT